MELAARMIIRRWPRGAFLDLTDYICGIDEVAFGQKLDLFVYRNFESVISWDAEDKPNDMIELAIVPGGLMVVVGDDKDPTMAGILAELEAVRLPGIPPSFT
jgi:hypothetical protein